MLVAYTRGEINTKLMVYALENTPSLVIDCARIANPHAFLHHMPFEHFLEVFVMTVEAVYRFRDSLLKAPLIARKIGAKTIVITTFSHLFSYDDKEEDEEVYRHAWELIKEMSKEFDVLVGVSKEQEKFLSSDKIYNVTQ